MDNALVKVPVKVAPARVTTLLACVNVASPLSQLITPPSAKNKSLNAVPACPRYAPSFASGTIPVFVVSVVTVAVAAV